MTQKITNEDLALMMKEGFDEIHEKFATKEDLKRFATKEDLKRFATKEDLKRFATKEELDQRIDEVLVQGDKSAKLMKDVKDELAAAIGARLRQQDEIDKNTTKLNNHETRIRKLELSSI